MLDNLNKRVRCFHTRAGFEKLADTECLTEDELRRLFIVHREALTVGIHANNIVAVAAPATAFAKTRPSRDLDCLSAQARGGNTGSVGSSPIS